MHDNRPARELGAVLLRRQMRCVTAESCTGGWIAQLLTSVAGSSAWFERGFVCYSDLAKQDMLGVPAATLRRHGAVSEPTVLAMVAGALSHSQAQAALAVSGIAGPAGGSATKPVGTVVFGWQIQGQAASSELLRLPGGRDAVRWAAVVHALQGLLARL